MSNRGFAAGIGCGIAAMLLIGAARSASVPSPQEAIGPVEVVLHRFDLVPGREAAYRAWIDMLHRRHWEAVATLGRERTYLEAMLTAPDEPSRLYWLTVQGAGGKRWRVRR